ncbi:MAG: methylmalonyl-CoA mutase family protein, partial [Desulfatiglandales bacterium]
MDEALCLPSEEAVQVALRTQQLIAYETNVCDTVDPLGGSYYIESLTEEIVKRAEDYIKRIDEMGGAVKAIEKGFIQREIQDSAYKYQKEIEEGLRTVVGVNRFKVEERLNTRILRVDPKVREVQIERLRELKGQRNNQEVERSLKRLKETAEGEENLMPAIYEAVKSYATLGEICGVLREFFGEYQPTVTIGR